MINNDFGLAFAIHLLEKYIQVERKNIYMMYLRTLRRRIYIFFCCLLILLPIHHPQVYLSRHQLAVNSTRLHHPNNSKNFLPHMVQSWPDRHHLVLVSWTALPLKSRMVLSRAHPPLCLTGQSRVPQHPRLTPLCSRSHPRCPMEQSRALRSGRWWPAPARRLLPLLSRGLRCGRSPTPRASLYRTPPSNSNSNSHNYSPSSSKNHYSSSRLSNRSNKTYHHNQNKHRCRPPSSHRQHPTSACSTSLNHRCSTRRSAIDTVKLLRVLWMTLYLTVVQDTGPSMTTRDRGLHLASKSMFYSYFSFIWNWKCFSTMLRQFFQSWTLWNVFCSIVSFFMKLL